MVALITPAASACHLLDQLKNLPVGLTDTMPAQSSETILKQRTTALEAPLIICEQYAMICPVLAAASTRRFGRGTSEKGGIYLNWKRFLLIVAVGKFCWITAFWSRHQILEVVSQSALTTCHLSQRLSVKAIWVMEWFAACFLLAAQLLILLWTTYRHAPKGDGHWAQSFRAILREETWRDAACVWLPGWAGGDFCCILTTSVVARVRGYNDSMLYYSFPRSGQSVLDLDQALALIGGILVVVYTVRSAWRARRHSPDADERLPSVELRMIH